MADWLTSVDRHGEALLRQHLALTLGTRFPHIGTAHIGEVGLME